MYGDNPVFGFYANKVIWFDLNLIFLYIMETSPCENDLANPALI